MDDDDDDGGACLWWHKPLQRHLQPKIETDSFACIRFIRRMFRSAPSQNLSTQPCRSYRFSRILMPDVYTIITSHLCKIKCNEVLRCVVVCVGGVFRCLFVYIFQTNNHHQLCVRSTDIVIAVCHPLPSSLFGRRNERIFRNETQRRPRKKTRKKSLSAVNLICIQIRCASLSFAFVAHSNSLRTYMPAYRVQSHKVTTTKNRF